MVVRRVASVKRGEYARYGAVQKSTAQYCTSRERDAHDRSERLDWSTCTIEYIRVPYRDARGRLDATADGGPTLKRVHVRANGFDDLGVSGIADEQSVYFQSELFLGEVQAIDECAIGRFDFTIRDEQNVGVTPLSFVESSQRAVERFVDVCTTVEASGEKFE